MSDTYAREQVEMAIGAGADLVKEQLSINCRDIDLINLVINSIMTKLEDPAVDDLDDVIQRSYESSPGTVRSWVE